MMQSIACDRSVFFQLLVDSWLDWSDEKPLGISTTKAIVGASVKIFFGFFLEEERIIDFKLAH